MAFYESHRRRPIYNSGLPQDSRPFYKRSRDLPVKGSPPGARAATSVPQSPVQVAALEHLVCLVQAGSCTVPLVTPAFQSNGSAELQRRCPFPFGSLRLPWVPLGGFATSRTPLAAVAARGAVDNINNSVVASACCVFLF